MFRTLYNQTKGHCTYRNAGRLFTPNSFLGLLIGVMFCQKIQIVCSQLVMIITQGKPDEDRKTHFQKHSNGAKIMSVSRIISGTRSQ